MKKHIFNFIDTQKNFDNKYPNRRKEIHKNPCKPCPSNQDKINGRTDTESEDIKKLPKKIIAKEYLFVCYLRQNKLCKGLCDYMEINEELLKNL